MEYTIRIAAVIHLHALNSDEALRKAEKTLIRALKEGNRDEIILVRKVSEREQIPSKRIFHE